MIPYPTMHKLIIKADNRGWFAEILKPQDIENKIFGQVSLTIARPQKKKGAHFHKIRTEWFTVIIGKVEFSLRHMRTGEKKIFTLSSSEPSTLLIPPFWYHELENKSKENAIILLYTDLAFNSENPDTYQLNDHV